MERLAILPTEILSRDPGLAWAGDAATGLASRALGAAPSTAAFAARDRADAVQRQATRFVHTYAVREAGTWKVRGTVEDAPTHRTVQEIEVTAAGPAEFGAAIASAIWPGAPKKTWNAAAVEAYGKAIRMPAAEAVPALREAVKTEPGFEDAWLLLAQMEMALSGREAAAAALAQAPQTAAVKLMMSTLRGDAPGIVEGLESAAKANPSDWESWAQLGAASVQARRFAEAATAFTKAIALQPRSENLLNQAAYAYQLAGNHAKALETLDAYQKLAPKSANPLDSRGEILTMAGKFDDAVQAFRDADAKDPKFLGGAVLLKAAEAKRLGGDVAAASGIFAEWEKSHAAHPITWMYRAQWEYTNGQKAEAEERLRKNASTAAWVQLTIWKLEQGDRKAAEEALNRAAATAGDSPANRNAVALGQALLTGETNRPAIRGVALVLRKDFSGAVPLLEQAVRAERPDQASPAPILLAWAYLETGQTAKAKELLQSWPIPRSGSDPFFECLLYPRILELRKRAGLG